MGERAGGQGMTCRGGNAGVGRYDNDFFRKGLERNQPVKKRMKNMPVYTRSVILNRGPGSEVKNAGGRKQRLLQHGKCCVVGVGRLQVVPINALWFKPVRFTAGW